MLRCSSCNAVFDIGACCPNSCGAQVTGVVDASGLRAIKDIGDAFAAVEQLDVIVKEVALDVDVLMRLDKDDVTDADGPFTIIGDEGLTNRHLWRAQVKVKAPTGRVLIWDEKQK